MKKISVLFFCLLLISSVQAQSLVRGFVFNDANGNGRKDKNEKGLPQVSVSNGVVVTQTGYNGSYELPVGKDNIIFVIKPSGFKIPLTEDNLPRFYRLHKPDGSPALKYKGVAPTPALPASLDFPLTAKAESDDYTALIFGDPQPYTVEEIEYFARGVVSEVEGIKNVEFGLSLGDLVGDNLDLHQPYVKAVKRVGLPWYNLMGNHDMDYDATSDSLSDDTYEAHFGPANYAFNYGKVHYIILDDILYPDPRDGKGYWGGFRKDQLDFVENDLKYVAKDQLIVLAYHIPLHEEGEGDAFRDEDRNRLFAILKDYPNTLALSAHTHLQRQNFHGTKAGWNGTKPLHEYNAGTTSGDWYSGEFNLQGVPSSTMRDGTPKGYAFLRIKGNQYSIDYKVAGEPKEYQIRIHTPRVVPAGRNTSSSIYANFFMGHEGNAVQYRIDNEVWKDMIFHDEPDPHFQRLVNNWDYTESLPAGRRPSNAVRSTHLWRAPFPNNLAEGQHTVEVKARDMFGQDFTQKHVFWAER
ncbi:calcineurin-like phosphoesterase C-terminal domain-containing protein [Dyadobacter crusticola]|uniref:calcineurin-like phosphoesterase C-terminal domain-containing protein n=1 Tax=Dyadobacter crusticola TaxID=292407 RepID=UPI0004E1F66D|nr:calcineurin-like phosphoesterase family protein [Dyadobacter crusticola]